MSNFDFSKEATNVLHQFYDCDILVYVEGEEDILFWYKFFNKYSYKFEIEYVEGRNEIYKLIRRIIDENLNICVAADRDYSDINGYKINDDKIVHTYGYSIENTMYCTKNINRAIHKYSKRIDDFESKINEWKRKFCFDVYRLILYDIANERYEKSIDVMGNACNRFLSSPKSPNLSNKKIDSYVSQIQQYFNNEEIKLVENGIKSDEKDLFYFIRGHFITNAVINLIKAIIKKEYKKNININHDSLYSVLIGCCSMGCSECCEYIYYNEKINKMISKLVV